VVVLHSNGSHFPSRVRIAEEFWGHQAGAHALCVPHRLEAVLIEGRTRTNARIGAHLRIKNRGAARKGQKG